MTAQPQLPPAPRAHDMPILWDGLRCAWGPWQTVTTTWTLHHPDRRRCDCGSQAEPHDAHGIVYAPPGTVTYLHAARTARDAKARREGEPVQWLNALRCPDCGLTTVWDVRTDKCWTLDETDYGDEGSWDE